MGYFVLYAVLLPLLAAVLYLPGVALASRLGEPAGRPGFVDRAVLGLLVWAALLFVLAASGLYTPAALRLAAAFAALASLAAWRLGGRTSLGEELALLRPTGGPLVLVLALGAAVAVLFLHALNPGVAWDADVYHLTLPKLYLEAGGFREVPFNVYSLWPSNAQLLFGLALALADSVLAALLHLLFGLLTVAAVFALCREAGRPRAGWLAAPLFLANGVVLFEMRVAYTDLFLAFLFAAAALYTLRAAGRPGERRLDLLLAGVAAGLAAGVKLTGLLILPCLAGLYLAAGGRAARSLPGLRALAAWTLAPAALLLAPWLGRSALATGNPAYPFLYSVFGGPDWSAALAERFAAWQRSIGMGREPLDYLLLPAWVILEGGRGYARFDGELHDLWIVLVPLALWGAWRSPWVRRPLGGVGLYFILWALSSQQMRFLIPALPLLAAAAALTVDELLEAIPRPTWRRAALQAVAVGAALLLGLEMRAQLPPTAPLARGLWTHGLAAHELAVPPLARTIHERTPEDARILFVNLNRRYHVDREVLADSFFEASQIAHVLLDGADSPGAARRRLEARGITHVLLHDPGWSVPLPPAFHELLADPGAAEELFVSPDGRTRLFVLQAQDG